MNAIDAHLEAALGAYDQTPQLDATRRELRSMMEDAYAARLQDGTAPSDAAGAVIAEFGDLDELAPTLGLVRTRKAGAHAALESSAHPPVTLGEAHRFAATARGTRFHLAGAVAAFVAAPALLAFLIIGSDTLRVRAETGIVIGLAGLFAAAAAGAMLLVRRSNRLSPYARIRNGAFRGSPHVAQWADHLRLENERHRTAMLAVAVLLWIASPLPLLVATLASPSRAQDLWIGAGAAGALLIVAVGLFLQLSATWAHWTAQELQHGRTL